MSTEIEDLYYHDDNEKTTWTSASANIIMLRKLRLELKEAKLDDGQGTLKKLLQHLGK